VLKIKVTNHHATHVTGKDYKFNYSAALADYELPEQYGATAEEAIGKLILTMTRTGYLEGIEIQDWKELC
jgi:hypothetical protein